jgi:hypothetical protein
LGSSTRLFEANALFNDWSNNIVATAYAGQGNFNARSAGFPGFQEYKAMTMR